MHIRAGERLSIQGPSGSGKTALGNILLGLVRPDEGAVERAAGITAVRFQKLYQDPAAAFAPRVTLRRSMRDLSSRLTACRGRAWKLSCSSCASIPPCWTACPARSPAASCSASRLRGS